MPPEQRVAVAVSGGPDSMALALLLHQWAKQSGRQVTALTVDHGLRPQAAAEAAQVTAWLGAWGMDHVILRWHGDKPHSAIQARARQARYDLMGQWCRRHNVPALAVAHHQQDQAETMLLRLRQGSGLDGLAGMSPQTPMPWGRIIRPLLTIPRSRLLACLRQGGQDFIQDPSNHDCRYERVRLRQMMAALDLSLGDVPQVLGQARSSMQKLVDAAEARLVRHDPLGFALVDGAALAEIPPAIGLRLLARLVRQVGGGAYAPGDAALIRLIQAGRGTLAGCRLIPKAQGVWLLCREDRHLPPPQTLLPGQHILWDGRFVAQAAADAPFPVTIAPLGAAGWRQLAAHTPRVASVLRHPLPAWWQGEKVLAQPHLDFVVPENACIFRDRHYFSIMPLRSVLADASEEGRNPL